MLSPTASTVRLFLHVMAATIWVGGQFALAGVVPVLRRQAPDTTKAVARAFAKVAWPAFAVLVITGIWNLVEIDITDTSTAYQATVFAKVALAMIAAAAMPTTAAAAIASFGLEALEFVPPGRAEGVRGGAVVGRRRGERGALVVERDRAAVGRRGVAVQSFTFFQLSSRNTLAASAMLCLAA